MPSSSPIYERGDALDDVALPVSDESSTAEDATPEQAVLDDLSTDQYWKWLDALVQKGGDIDQHLDSILDRIYKCEPRFYSWTGRRELQALLAELHDLREVVRAYEQDVEQLWYTFAKSDEMETDAAQNADLTLESLKRTYDRAYDLCLYKFDRMAENWVTATNLLISFTILIVTILFWMEFR